MVRKMSQYTQTIAQENFVIDEQNFYLKMFQKLYKTLLKLFILILHKNNQCNNIYLKNLSNEDFISPRNHKFPIKNIIPTPAQNYKFK